MMPPAPAHRWLLLPAALPPCKRGCEHSIWRRLCEECGALCEGDLVEVVDKGGKHGKRSR